jgi:hypothetical protein
MGKGTKWGVNVCKARGINRIGCLFLVGSYPVDAVQGSSMMQYRGIVNEQR